MQRGTIERRRDGGASILVLRGEHDIETAPALRAELERALVDGTPILVDLSQARFIDSTVLGALIYGRERRQPFALVVPPGCAAHRLCEIVELGGIVPTFPSQADAISDLTAAAGHRGE